jgi:hypothetical protein
MRGWFAALPLLLALGPVAADQTTPAPLPAPPANGELGFLVETFTPPIVFEPQACPSGHSPKLREAYLAAQPPEEQERLRRKENEAEFTKRWQAQSFGPEGTNICSQPDRFDRPLIKIVQSPRAYGLDLDDGTGADVCAQDDFIAPDGASGIDNQEYRVMGCVPEWRGVDGKSNDQDVGMRQFMASGEWTQVILLRGVDSLVADDAVEVIYANTPDRPIANSKGQFLRGASFTVGDKAPRNRNVLRGRIANGVLTTEPADIKLVQTWGQGGARDIRGNRTKFDFRKGRLRLTFRADGTVDGMLGGYKPVFDVIQSPAIGGVGSAIVAGIDCAGILKTLRHHADGLRDPASGKCTGVSAAIRIVAIPAFVTDIPGVSK